MKRFITFAAIVGATSSVAMAQPAQELTLFSSQGFSGARFTVTGPRTILRLPFVPRSAILQGGGSWELCGGQSYAGRCQTIARNERDLRLAFPNVQSVRPAAAAASPWREIARLNVRDSAGMDVASVTDGEFYREVMVCGERGTVRIRRADLQFGNGQWQRLFLPLALSPGQCSKAVALQGNGRRIRAIRFDHEAWTPGIRGATLVIRALPHVVPQPR